MTGFRAKGDGAVSDATHTENSKSFFFPVSCRSPYLFHFFHFFLFETETFIDGPYYGDNGKRNTEVVVASKPGCSEHKILAGTTTLQGQETDVKNTRPRRKLYLFGWGLLL